MNFSVFLRIFDNVFHYSPNMRITVKLLSHKYRSCLFYKELIFIIEKKLLCNTIQEVVQDVIQRFKNRCVRYFWLSGNRNCGLLNKRLLSGFPFNNFSAWGEMESPHSYADIRGWCWKHTLIHYAENIWSGNLACSFVRWWFLEPVFDHVRFVMSILLSDERQNTQGQGEALNINVYEFCFSWSLRVTT